ncbi:MAG: MACPF domain-containing protein [Pseudomonadota bacterium]|nr:MACPF domain-containing protein [Pseudomonadota bacterium]
MTHTPVIKVISVQVPLTPSYTDETGVAFDATTTVVTLPVTGGDHVFTSETIRVGSLANYPDPELAASLTIKYNYNAAENMLTFCGNELNSPDSPSLAISLGKQRRPLSQTRALGAHEEWNFSTQTSPSLHSAIQGTVQIANDAIINAAKVQGFNVLVLCPLPVLDKDEYERMSAVYLHGKFLEFYDPAKTYGDGFNIVELGSYFKGKVTFAVNQDFANVIGSTDDPKHGVASWIALWRKSFGKEKQCASLNFPSSVTCKGTLVGGHVVLGTATASPTPGDSNSVYIIPICKPHNGNNNVYMRDITTRNAIALQNYFQMPRQMPNDNLVPGASVLGFGINIARASGPTDVTTRLVSIDETGGTTVVENNVTYILPANVSLINVGSSSLEYSTFSSREEYSKHKAAEMQVAASGWGFSGEFDASYSSLAEGGSVSAYGLVEANTTLWSVSAQDLQGLALTPTFKSELDALPTDFNLDTQQSFFDLFNKYGTHVISTALVGGSLEYLTTASSSSKFDTETAAANMKMEYKSVFVDASGSASADWENIDKSWFSSRQAKLVTIGGSPSILQYAVPPTNPDAEVNYQELVVQWGKSVATQPAITNLHLQPLSHLAPATQLGSLNKALDAYLNKSARASSAVQYDSQEPKTAATSMFFGSKSVAPPNMPGKDQLSMYWIVMADEHGDIKFNDNALSNDPDDFDALVAKARAASDDKNWWTAIVVRSTPGTILSEEAQMWMGTCGVAINQQGAYPNWPLQIAAIGISNSPDFKGILGAQWVPRYQNPYGDGYPPRWRQQVDVEIPLYISI